MLIQVGSTEVLLDDAEQLAARCAEAGVPCTLQVWDNAIHVFQSAADFIPDARQAVEAMAAFHRRVLDEGSAASAAAVPDKASA